VRWRRGAGDGPRTGYRGPAAAADGAGRRALRGAVLLSLLWVVVARLGVHDAAGLPELRHLPVVAAVGALLGWWGWIAPVWLMASVTTACLLAVTATPVMRPAVAALLVRDPAPDAAGADAVFVLSSAVTPEGRIARQGPERLLHGLALAKATGVPLVVSEIRPRSRPESSSLPDQRALAALAGVEGRLEAITDVGSTRDEAVRVAALARARGWRRLAVVTSPVHARRACATVARAGVAVRCAPAPSRELDLAGPRALEGTEARAHAFALWLYETIAWALYRARGWV
jgi:uncharacterized SAM-binding protein YcdF (DUF218 family)